MEWSASIKIPISITLPVSTHVSASNGDLSVAVSISFESSDASEIVDTSVEAPVIGPHFSSLWDSFSFAPKAMAMMDFVTLAEIEVVLLFLAIQRDWDRDDSWSLKLLWGPRTILLTLRYP